MYELSLNRSLSLFAGESALEVQVPLDGELLARMLHVAALASDEDNEAPVQVVALALHLHDNLPGLSSEDSLLAKFVFVSGVLGELRRCALL